MRINKRLTEFFLLPGPKTFHVHSANAEPFNLTSLLSPQLIHMNNSCLCETFTPDTGFLFKIFGRKLRNTCLTKMLIFTGHGIYTAISMSCWEQNVIVFKVLIITASNLLTDYFYRKSLWSFARLAGCFVAELHSEAAIIWFCWWFITCAWKYVGNCST